MFTKKYLLLILVLIEFKNVISDDRMRESINDSLIKFCLGKSPINFCSKDNLDYMFKVVEMKLDKEIRKTVEDLKKKQLEIKQQKLKIFLQNYPKYKFISELPISRFL